LGYKSFSYTAPLYPDVFAFFAVAAAKGNRALAIYSSGSVQAQRLFFAHCDPSGGINSAENRDITYLFKNEETGQERLFDTVSAGSKVEDGSYKKIARHLDVREEDVVFFTDNVKGKCYISWDSTIRSLPAVANNIYTTRSLISANRSKGGKHSRHVCCPAREARQCSIVR
jgi:hypothetical protein